MTQNQTTTPEDLAPPLDEEVAARGAPVADAGVAPHASSPTKFGSLLERLEAAVAASEKAAAELELASCSRAAPSQASSRRAAAKKHGSVRESPITGQEAPTSSTHGIARETPDVSTGGPQEAPGAASLQQQAVVSPMEPATRKRRLSKTPSQHSAEESEGVRAEVPSVSSSMPAPTTAEPRTRRKLVKTVVLPSADDGVEAACAKTVEEPLAAPVEPPSKRLTWSKRLGASQLVKTVVRTSTDEGVDVACAKTVVEPLAAPVEPPSKRLTRSKTLGASQLVKTVVRTSTDEGVDAACAKKLKEPLAAPVEPPSKRLTRPKKLEALQLVKTVVRPSLDEGADAACAEKLEEPPAARVEPPSKRPRRSKRVEALLAMGKRERQRYVSQLSDRQQMALTVQLSLCEGGA